MGYKHFRTTRLDPGHCPNCRHPLDAAASFGERAKPAPGDVTICIQCRSILVFGHDMRVRWPNDAEMIQIAGDRRIVMAQRMLAQVKRSST